MGNSEVGWSGTGSGGRGPRPKSRGTADGAEARLGQGWLRAFSPSWLLKGLSLASLLAIIVFCMDDDGAGNGPSAEGGQARILLGSSNARLVGFAISPNGRTVATSHDIAQRRVALWSLGEPNVRPRRLRFGGPAENLAFSPNGRFLAVGGESRDVIVVDLANKLARRVLRTPWPVTKALAFSPDGNQLAVSTRSSVEIGIWELATGQAQVILKGRGPALDLQFAPDGKSLAAGEYHDARVTVWDLETGRPRVFDERPAGGAVRSVAFSKDGRLLATFGYWDAVVQVWEAAVGRLVGSIRVSGERPQAIAFAPDGRRIVVGTGKGTIVLHNLETGREDGRLVSQTMSPKLAFTDGGRTLMVAGDDTNELLLWHVPQAKPAQSPVSRRPATVADRGPASPTAAPSSQRSVENAPTSWYNPVPRRGRSAASKALRKEGDHRKWRAIRSVRTSA